MAEKAEARAAVTEVLQSFLRPKEKVLLCTATVFSEEVAQAVTDLSGDLVLWNQGQSWQDLLRQVFARRVTVLIGPPKVILALAKIARITGTPLPVRHVVLLGTAREPWLLKGIQDSLDAKIHTCDLPSGTENSDPLSRKLDEMLLSWSSILDYQAEQTQQGLCMEIVVFPGRKLPQLPSGASITVRPWRPAEDGPLSRKEC